MESATDVLKPGRGPDALSQEDVRKPHRALGAHRNARVSQQVPERLANPQRSRSVKMSCTTGVKKLLMEHTLSFVSSPKTITENVS